MARASAALPALLFAFLLARRGGLPAGTLAIALGLATIVFAAGLARASGGRGGRVQRMGALDAAVALALAGYAATGVIGIYPGAAVPAVALAALAALVFRAARETACDPAAARRQALLLVVLAATAGAAAVALSMAGGGPGRAPAAFPLVNHDHLAALAAGALPLALVLAATAPDPEAAIGGGDAEGVWSWVMARQVGIARIAAPVLGVALAFSVSRGGIAAGLAGIAAIATLLVRRRGGVAAPFVLGGVSVAAVVAWIAFEPLARKLGAGAIAVSAGERLAIAGSAWRAFLVRPIAGSGAGGFAAVFPAHRTAEVPYRVDHAHTEPLELAVESGVLGLALAGLVGWALVRTVWPAARERRPLRMIVAGALAGVGALVLHGLVDFPLRIPAIAVEAAWLAGLAAGAAEARRAGRRVYGPEPIALESAGARLGAGAALAIAVLIAALSGAHGWAAWSATHGGDPRRAARVAPWNAGLWRAAGDAAVARGMAGAPAALEDARGHYAEALRRNPRDAESAVARGRLALLAGEDADAIADFERAIASDPAHPGWRMAHARALLSMGRVTEATEACRAAIVAAPGLRRRAFEALAAAVGPDPATLRAAIPEGDAAGLAALAGFLEEAGRLEEARAAMSEAAGIEPAVYAGVAARMLESGGEKEAAAALVESGLKALGVECERPGAGAGARTGAGTDTGTGTGTDTVVALLALRARLATEKDVAQASARCAVGVAPSSAAAWMLVAELGSDDRAAAEEAWRRAAELSPADPAPLIGLSRLRAREGDPSGALEAAREAEGRATCEGAGALEVTSLLDARGMRAAAIAHLEELAQRCPDSTAIATRTSLWRAR